MIALGKKKTSLMKNHDLYNFCCLKNMSNAIKFASLQLKNVDIFILDI